MKFDTYLYTNQGGRAYNEDTANYKLDGVHGIFVVADGLGGHGKGDLASQCVVDTILSNYQSGKIHDRQWFEQQIAVAHEKVSALQQETNGKMKSTVVALTIDAVGASWAHVGDSRLYYLSEGKIKACTQDHSVAYTKYQMGQITKVQIAMDEDQSSLLRSIGGGKSTPEIYWMDESEVLQKGDGFLLCSDGLWEYLYDEEILIDYLKADSAREWAEWMLLRVMNRVPDDHDNLTLITVLLKDGRNW